MRGSTADGGFVHAERARFRAVEFMREVDDAVVPVQDGCEAASAAPHVSCAHRRGRRGLRRLRMRIRSVEAAAADEGIEGG